MGAKKIVDNNMSQDALLRSVKPAIVAPQIDSSLKPNEKALAESILNTLLEKSEGSEDYMLRLTSKNTDALMGRIETYIDKVKDNFTSNELANVKNAILEAIQAAVDATPLSIEVSDISKVVLQIVQKLSDEILAKLDQIISSVEELLTKSLEEKEVVEQAAPAEPAEPAQAVQEESDAKDMSEFEAPSDKDEFTEEDLNEIQTFISTLFTLLTNLVTDIGEQITANINAVNTAIVSLLTNMQESINSLLPSAKDKKAAKKAKKAQDELNRIIKDMDEAVKKIQNFTENFIQVMIDGFETFMNGIFKVLFAFFLKLMCGIVVPFLLVVGLALYLLADPLMEILLPIMNFISDVLRQLLDFLRPIRDLVIRIVEKIFEKVVLPILEDVVKPILKDVVKPLIVAIGEILIEFFKAIQPWIKPIVDTIFKILKTFLEAIQPWIRPIVDTIFRILQTFLLALEPWIEPLVDVVLSTLIEIMATIRTVVEIFNEFLKGFKSNAEAIGDAVGKVVLEVVKCVKILVEFFQEVGKILIDIAKIVRAPIKFIADFFEGFNSNAKKIGEKISEIALVVADIILKILKALDGAITGIRRFIMVYVVAPLNALKRWINAKMIWLGDRIWIPIIRWGQPNSGNWTGIGDVIDMLRGMRIVCHYVLTGKETSLDAPYPVTPNPDADKSLSLLISDEMGQMEEKLQQEEAAAKQAEVTRALERKKIEDMLNHVKLMEDMSNQVKEIHAKFMEQKELPKIDFTEIINKMNESLEALVPKIQDMLKAMSDTISDALGQLTDALSEILNSITLHLFDIVEILNEIAESVAWFKEQAEALPDKVNELTLQAKEFIDVNVIAKLNEMQDLSKAIYDIVTPLPQIAHFVINSVNEKTEQVAEKIYSNIIGVIDTLGDVRSQLSNKVQQAEDDILVNINTSFMKSEEKMSVALFRMSQTIISSVTENIQKLISPMVNSVSFGFSRMASIFTDDPFDKVLKKVKEAVDDIFGHTDEVAKSSLDAAKSLIDEAEHRLEVSVQEVMPDIQRLDNIEDAGKTEQKSLFEKFTLGTTDSMNNDSKKASKALSSFQSKLMKYLDEMFGEVLERLGKEDQQVPVPIPVSFNPNNPASLENL